MYMFVTPYSIQVNTGRLKKNKTKKKIIKLPIMQSAWKVVFAKKATFPRQFRPH